MSDREHKFWISDHKYEDLVRQFEENIERVHPDYVTSDRLSPYSYYGTWNKTMVSYYEYRGPDVIHL